MILGGLFSATALNMVVLPALYWLYGERAVVPEEAGAEGLQVRSGLATVRLV